MKHTLCVFPLHQVLHDSHYVLHKYYNLHLSSGQWEVPVITGTRPPPLTHFSLNTLPGNRGVIFGGTTVDETGKHRVNDLYSFSCSRDAIVRC